VPYVIDLNQGSYANGVITIDATSQLNGAERFACLRDAYIMLPYKVSMKNSSTTAGQVLGAAANRLSVGNWNVIDAMSLELNGKSILSMTEYKMFANNLRAQFETSPAYVEKHGAESFLYPDSSGSLTWSATAGGSGSGDGYTNTSAKLTGELAVSATGAGVKSSNEGFVKRLLANPPVANANTNGWPTIASGSSNSIANQLGRGAFKAGGLTIDTIAGTWNYILKIKLVDLHPIFKELSLMSNCRIQLRFRVNQGSSVITTAANKMSLASTTLASGQTCPVMVASCATGHPNESVITGAGQISVAWGAITNTLEPSVDSTYLPFTTTRLYVPFVDLENPQAIISKPVKTVKYLDYYAQWFYQRTGIGVLSSQDNASFDLQLSASRKNAKYVALMPFAETSDGNYASASTTNRLLHSDPIKNFSPA
jgi:hypothetical protein